MVIRLLACALPLLAVIAFLACAEPASVAEPVESTAVAIDTGSCENSSACASRCDDVLQRASATATEPAYNTSRCELAALTAGDLRASRPTPSCLCFEDGATEPSIVLSSQSPDPCLAYGRDRQCLYPVASFLGCDLERPDESCKDACAELERRQHVDALRRVDIRLRGSSCSRTGCHCVLDINRACYVDDWYDEYDCRQSDERILDAFDATVLSAPAEPAATVL